MPRIMPKHKDKMIEVQSDPDNQNLICLLNPSKNDDAECLD